MARTVSWRYRIPEIRQRVQNSVVETWTRRDFETVFEIKRAAAQLLMKAVGEIHNVGGTYAIDRPALLAFLETLEKSEDLEAARREKLLLAEPVPRPQFLNNTLSEDLRSVMVRDLPPEITLEPGRLEITGANAEQIVERLWLLAAAMQNDLDTAAASLNPPPAPRRIEDEDLKALFANLRERETAFSESAPGSLVEFR
jgi:hypothetical protein